MISMASVISDPDLASSRVAFQADDVAQALAPFFMGAKLKCVNVRVLRYRPGRRVLLAYSIHIRDPGGDMQRMVILAKAYRNKRAGRVFEVLRQAHACGIASSGSFRVPAPIALLADGHVVVYERMDGVSLDSISDVSSFAITGTALAAFHATTMCFEEVRTPEEEILDARSWLHKAVKLNHKLLEAGESVLESMDDALYNLENVMPRPLHRDFYPANVLLGKVPAFIDLDDAAMGDPSLDAGNFLAHLRLLPATVQQVAANAFISAMRHCEALPEPNLQFYEIASLVRIAGVHAVRYGRTRLAARLIREAQLLAECSK